MNSFGARLGKLIKAKRERAGFTVVGLAEEAFQDPSKARRIADLEAGKYALPQAKTFGPLIETLSITDEEVEACRSGRSSTSDEVLLDRKIQRENANVLGRDVEISEIGDLFDTTAAPIALTGPGGIGKTALADAFARSEVGKRFSGAWRVAVESDEGWRALAAALREPSYTAYEVLIPAVLDRLARLRDERGKPFLLIHDNVDNEQVQRRLIGRLEHPSFISHLITARLEDWEGMAHPWPILELSADDAVALLASIADREIDEGLTRIAVDYLDRLPLALLIVGADMKKTGVSAQDYGTGFLQILKRAPAGRVYDKSLYAVVMGSFELLDEAAAAVANFASFLDPSDIDPLFLVEGARAMADRGWGPLPRIYAKLAEAPNDLARALEDARSINLLRRSEFEGEQTLRMHRLAQAVLRDALSFNDRMTLLAIVGILGRAQMPDNVQFEASDWPRTRRLAPHAVRVSAMLQALSEDELAQFATLAKDQAAYTTGYVETTAQFLTHANADLDLAESLYAANLTAVRIICGFQSREFSIALGNLGRILDLQARRAEGEEAKLLDQEAEAKLAEALRVATIALGEIDLSVASKHSHLQNYYYVRKRFEEAERHATAALQIRERLDTPPELIGSAHGNLGRIYSDWAEATEDSTRAAEHHSRALSHFGFDLTVTRDALGERTFDTSIALYNLALEHARTGDPARGLSLQILATAIPIAMHRMEIIEADHPALILKLSQLASHLDLLHRSDDPQALAETSVGLVEATHRAWEAWKSGKGPEPAWPFAKDGSILPDT
jgi:tetratricopeptide (TPR) repeat protein